jgi:hypothetical protein
MITPGLSCAMSTCSTLPAWDYANPVCLPRIGTPYFSRKRMSNPYLTKGRAKPSFLRNGQRVYNLDSDNYLTLVQFLTQYMSCVTLFRGSDY